MSIPRKTHTPVLAMAIIAIASFANGCASQGLPFAVVRTTPQPQRQHRLDRKFHKQQKQQQVQPANFSVARANEHEGNLNDALMQYQQLYIRNPSDALVCHRLGVVKLRMGQIDDGLTYLMEANALDSMNASILGDLGYGYIMKGDFEASERYLREALNINPEDSRCINNLAMTVGFRGRMEEAFSLYRQVNGQAEAHANMGYLYSQRGESSLAIRHYSKALDMDPTLRSAGEALVQIVDLETQVAAARTQSKPSGIQLTGGQR